MENTITLRRAEEKDIPGIMALLEQVLSVHHGIRPDLFKPGATKYSPFELAGIIQDDRTPVFVAVDEAGRVLAHCFCVFQQYKGHHIMTDVKTLYIDDLCVDEAQRGQRIGKSLYDHAVAFARESGCYNVTLNVWAGNDSAFKFYQAQGLRPQKYGMETIL